jgi:AraC-like DNA-binding protein
MRFSTDALPQKDRLAYFRESFARGICKIDYTPLTDEPFRARFDMAFFPECSLTRVDMSRTHSLRTLALLADGCDDIHLVMSLDGTARASQIGREALLSNGDALLMSASEAGHGEGSRQLTIGMSRRRLKALLPHIEDRLLERIPRDTPFLRLLMGLIHSWQHGELAGTLKMQQTFSDHLYDLIALLFGARGEAAEQAQQRGLSAAHLTQIEREIHRHALDPAFSLPMLAQCLGVPVSHVQKLLAGQGTSFTRQLTHERLHLARHLLRSPAHTHLPIVDIAYQCGFNTLEHFHRTFRAHFGAMAGEVRERVGG